MSVSRKGELEPDEALAAERKRLAVTLRSIGDGVIATDAEGRVTVLNPIAEHLTGWKYDQAVGRPIGEVFHIINERTRERCHDPVKKVISTGRMTGLANHTAVIAKDGTETSIADSCAPIRDKEGNVLGAVLVFRDITQEKLAEQALRDSEERFRSVAQSANDGIVSVNGAGEVVYWNEAAAKMFGYSVAQVEGRPLTVIMPARFRGPHKDGLKQLVETGQPKLLGTTVEVVGLKRDGTEFPVELSLSRWTSGGAVFFTGIIRDIAERKRAEQELVSERKRLATTLQSIGDGVISTDAVGRVVSVNSVAENLTGWTEAEAAGKPLDEIFHIVNEDTRERAVNPLEKVLKTGLVVGLANHTALISRDGTERSIADSCAPIRDQEGNLLGAVLVFRDVTEQKVAEERFRAVAESAADAVITVDSQGNIAYLNKAAERIFGYTTEEAAGRPLVKLMPERFRPRHEKGFGRVVSTGSSKWLGQTVEVTGLKKDGAEFPAELSLATWKAGDQLFFTGIVRDITRRKQTEEALAAERERLAVTLRSIGDGVISTDVDGRVVLLNEIAERLTGWQQEQAAGRPITEVFNIINERSRKPAENPIAKVLKQGTVVDLGHDTVLISRVGAETSIADSCAPIRDADGRVVGAVLVFRDVTEQKRAEAERKRAKQLADALNQINTAITSTLEFDEIMQRVASESARAIGAESSGIFLLRNSHWVPEHICGELAERSPEMMGRRFTAEEVEALALASRSDRPIAVADAYTDGQVGAKLMKKYRIRAFLAAPLKVREEVIGMLAFLYHSGPANFSDTVIDFAAKLATSVSLALENARLYAEERHIADTLQEALLDLPHEIPGVDFGHLYRSATEAAKIGGDFYDVFEISPGKVGILVGDVSGKGLEAASLTALIKNTIKAYAHHDEAPGTIMEKTNDVVSKGLAPSMFITSFFGILDVDSGAFSYCSAGHPPVIVRRKTSGVKLLGSGAPPIGVLRGIRYGDASATLARGDTLILYTDGVTEARRGRDFFGEDKLIKLVRTADCPPAGALPQRIFDEVTRFSGGTLGDDIALLAVTFMPRPGG